jgi:proline iminopeptidase
MSEVRRIPVTTPSGTFEVWTERRGTSADTKVLLLHGGPGATHEYLEAFDDVLPAAGIEIYQYDQLGSHLSDQPDDPSLWSIPRFVDEVEQVRTTLGLGPDDFYLYGQSWGGILAIEYALAHPDALKGLVISNMMASIAAYNAYAEAVLMPEMDPAALAELKAMEAEGRYAEPRYEELLQPHYERHVMRAPADTWPDAVKRTFEHMNTDVYVPMQGPSELGASGVLATWDRFEDLAHIDVSTLVIGAEHDTMDPEHLRAMAARLPQGEYHHCPDGSHMAMWDDQEVYLVGLISWLTRPR